MKRITVLIALALGLLSPGLAPAAHAQAAGAAAPAAAQAPSSLLDAIMARGTLRVGLTGDYKPFSIVDAAAPAGMQGLDVDMADSLAKSLGVKLQIVPTTWKSLMPDLLAGKFDIAMGGITVTTLRARTALFSTPVMASGKTALARCADVRKYQTLAQIDRPGVRVVVNPGGTNEAFDRAHLTKAKIVMVKTNPETFQALLDHKADVMITDGVETLLQHKLHPSLCPIHPDHPFNHSELAYMLPRDVIWQQYVDTWLRIDTLDGSRAALLKKWLD
ncbi:MAG: transporter substrate-binding domain-containing protein [Rhodospirillales bacterium]|nr:transporter substrate-binding domain-containing protein [Rhodospirillales bacterium]